MYGLINQAIRDAVESRVGAVPVAKGMAQGLARRSRAPVGFRLDGSRGDGHVHGEFLVPFGRPAGGAGGMRVAGER